MYLHFADRIRIMVPPHDFLHWRAHPWHGLETGPAPPRVVHAFIEITPFDLIKYEIDKKTGYLKVDRPQRTSSLPPSLYGFIPQTLCGRRAGLLSGGSHEGDGDPLDICVISERPINRQEVLIDCRVVGGLLMIDNEMADDKIIAVLHNDPLWGGAQDLSDLPDVLIDRLKHYFNTYKMLPGAPFRVKIEAQYPAEHAFRVIEAAIQDYNEEFHASKK
jgi:inorganic pyrophosphatase